MNSNNINWLGNSVVDPNGNRQAVQSAKDNTGNQAGESAQMDQNHTSPRYPIDMEEAQEMKMGNQQNMTNVSPMADNQNMADTSMGNNQNMMGMMDTSMGNNQNMMGMMDTSMGNNQNMMGMMDTSMGNNQNMMGMMDTSMGNKPNMMGMMDMGMKMSPGQNMMDMGMKMSPGQNMSPTTQMPFQSQNMTATQGMGIGAGFMGAGTSAGAPQLGGTQEGPPPVMDRDYIAGYLLTLIGRKILAEFIIGNNFYTDKAGTLTEVGVNFFVVKDLITNADVMCDLYSVRFVTAL